MSQSSKICFLDGRALFVFLVFYGENYLIGSVQLNGIYYGFVSEVAPL